MDLLRFAKTESLRVVAALPRLLSRQLSSTKRAAAGLACYFRGAGKGGDSQIHGYLCLAMSVLLFGRLQRGCIFR